MPRSARCAMSTRSSRTSAMAREWRVKRDLAYLCWCEAAEGDHVGRAPRVGAGQPASGCMTAERHLHQSEGGNSYTSRHLDTRSRSLCNSAGDPDRLSHHVRTEGKRTEPEGGR